MLKVAKKLSKATSCDDGLSSKFCLVLGLQWGREGKRKLLNKLCVDYDYSCRFNGGNLSEPSKSKSFRSLIYNLSSSIKAFANPTDFNTK